jgi:hypothetical protein
MSIKIKSGKKISLQESHEVSWDEFMENFLTDDDKNREPGHEDLEESGYWGQGHGSGAESFHGGYFGFGGDKQLATKLNPAVEKIRKDEQGEIQQNAQDQQQSNRVRPPASGNGSSNATGLKFPNSIVQIGKSSEELDNLYSQNPTKNYWGPADNEEIPLDIDLTTEETKIDEQVALVGGAGPQRGAASDGNYRDIPGNGRPNKLDRPIRHVPPVKGDEDNNGEEDVYLEDDEYVNDVLRLNGINQPTKKVMKGLGITPTTKTNEVKKYSFKSVFFEGSSFVSPANDPEPSNGTERYKQGRWLDTPSVEVDPTKAIMGYKDYSNGHASVSPAKETPGARSWGAIGAPKNFVPDDWEQRSNMTKEDDFDKTQLTAENIVEQMINETILSFLKKESYTGINGNEKEKSKGGSAAFEKNKEEILDIDAKEKKNLTTKTRK